MIETSQGWLFLGKDGELYRAEYSSPDEWFDPGWVVAHVRTEWWGQVFPEEE